MGPRSARRSSLSLPFHNSRARGCGAARGGKFHGSAIARLAAAQGRHANARVRRRTATLARPESSHALARRPSFKLACPSWGPKQGYTTFALLSSLLFCINGQRRSFIPGSRRCSYRVAPSWIDLCASVERGTISLPSPVGLGLGPVQPRWISAIRPKSPPLASACQSCSAASSARFKPTWASCSATAWRQPPPRRAHPPPVRQTCRFCG